MKRVWMHSILNGEPFFIMTFVYIDKLYYLYRC